MRTRQAKTVVIVATIAGIAVLIGVWMAIEPWYLKQLESDLTEVRTRAVQRLEMLGSTKLIPRLIELPARDPDKLVFASRTLARIGEPAVPSLRAALTNKHQMIRNCAARALSEIDYAAYPAALVEALEHDDPQVRIYALSRLTQIAQADRNTVAAILRALADEDAGVRSSAATALGRAAFGNGAPIAIQPLGSRLTDPDVSVRRAAANALRHLAHWGQPNVATLFASALRDKDEEVRWSAVLGLKESGVLDESVLSALGARLEDPSARVRTAAESLLKALRRDS